MKRVLIVGVCLLVAGCWWDVTAVEWAKASELCAPHGGVEAMDSARGASGFQVTARCADKTRVERWFSREK